MINKDDKELMLSVHFIILLIAFITSTIWYIIYVPYYLMISDYSTTYFYTATYCILWISYTVIKLFLTSQKKYNGEVLFWSTIVSYTVLYAIIALPFMIFSFFQKMGQNAFLHAGIIIIIIEKLGRFYLSTKIIDKGDSITSNPNTQNPNNY